MFETADNTENVEGCKIRFELDDAPPRGKGEIPPLFRKQAERIIGMTAPFSKPIKEGGIKKLANSPNIRNQLFVAKIKFVKVGFNLLERSKIVIVTYPVKRFIVCSY